MLSSMNLIQDTFMHIHIAVMSSTLQKVRKYELI